MHIRYQIVCRNPWTGLTARWGLPGRVVGMTLYYTDLVMKLWSFDYKDSAPPVPGFVPKPEYPISGIYEQAVLQSPATRSWLGVRSDGYELHDNGYRLQFAPISTRIYNAGSNDLFPGREDRRSQLPIVPLRQKASS